MSGQEERIWAERDLVKCKPIEFIPLKDLIARSEEWLMHRILSYAKERGYVKYTSTLAEAWRMSISGISSSLIGALEIAEYYPELAPDEDYEEDPIASFGIVEARRHRARGVTLGMYLGLMKYYRQSYMDLIRQADFDKDAEEHCRLFVNRFFDRVELGFTTEWSSMDENEKLDELKSSNRSMTNEKNKYLTIFESIQDPAILLDKQSRIENINHAAAKVFFGIDAPGKVYYNLSPTERALPWLAEKIDFFTRGKTSEITFETTVPINGRERQFVVKLQKMLDVSEKFAGTMVIFHDVTELKETQASLIRHRDDLMRTLTELKITQSQMVQNSKLASLGRLAGGVAHEINNPLAYAYGNVQLLEKQLDDLTELLKAYAELQNEVEKEAADPERALELAEKASKLFEKINKNFNMEELPDLIKDTLDGLTRIKNIVKALKDFASPGSGEKVLCDLNQCVGATLKLVSSAVGKKARVITNLEEIPPIMCISQELNEALVNMIINASQAMDKMGFIEITTAFKDPNVVLKIKDAGHGIPRDIIDRIFDPFFTTRAVGEGMGLGLSITYGIVRNHGGTIEVESEPGLGTTFTVKLPVPA